MAKMFYTIEEVAEKLGKTQDEVREMASSGQIQEFRDRDKLMFKVEQIDLLAGDDEADAEDSMSIGLEDSAGASGISLAESDLGMSDSREGTGISVFDTDHGDEGQPSESDQTQVSDTGDDELGVESVGSGSGLLDLTRESDDTALGAELLDEAFSADDQIDMPGSASGLFEATPEGDAGAEEYATMGAGAPVMVEAYDGTGSGLGVGMMVGALVSLVCVLIIAMVGAAGVTSGLATYIAGNLWLWVGVLAAVPIVLGVVGLFVGKASE